MHSLQWSWILFLVALPLGYSGGKAGIISMIIIVIGLVLYIKGLVSVIKHGVWGTRFHIIFATILCAFIVIGIVAQLVIEFWPLTGWPSL